MDILFGDDLIHPLNNLNCKLILSVPLQKEVFIVPYSIYYNYRRKRNEKKRKYKQNQSKNAVIKPCNFSKVVIQVRRNKTKICCKYKGSYPH